MGADMYTVDCVYNVHSGYGSGADTLGAAIAKGTWAREYYEALYPGTVRVGLFVRCESCAGAGRIGKGRKNVRFPKYKDCAACGARGCFPLPVVV